MKLYIENDNGIKTELAELEETNTLDGDTLILTTSKHITAECATAIQEKFKEFGKKCIILYGFDKVYSIK